MRLRHIALFLCTAALGAALGHADIVNPYGLHPTTKKMVPANNVPTSLLSGGVDQGNPAVIAKAWPVEVTDGTDVLGTAAHPLRCDPTGTTPQPVTMSSAPLPSGGATAARQDTGNTSVASIDTKLSSQATASNQATGNASLTTIAAATDVALSTRASAANQTTGNASLSSIDTKLSSQATAANQTTAQTSLSSIDTKLSSQATAANQTTANASLSSIDGKTPTVGQKAMAASSPVVIASDQSTLPVSLASAPLPTGAATEATLATRAADATITARFGTLGQKASAGSAPVVIASDQSAVPMSVASLPLPSGAATEATLSTRAADATITARLGTLGQKTSANSTPVVLASDQSGVPVTGTFWQATQPVSGAVSVSGNVATTSAAASQADGHSANIGALADASSASTLTGLLKAIKAAVTGTLAISAASLPLPSGAATAAKQPALGTAGTASADVISVQGVASMTALKVDGSATTQPVSGTFWQSTQPVSGTLTCNVGTSGSLALEATQTSGAAKAQLTDSSGNAIVLATTTPGASDRAAVVRNIPSGTQTVAGTVAVSNSFALDASVTGLQVAQNSTTSGQSGSLMQGAVTTAAPSYTTAKTSPVSLTTAGALRTDGSATTQPVSGTVTANAGSGNFTVIQATAANLLAQVFGGAANGSAVSGNPVLFAGYDGTNARTMRLDATGRPAGSSFLYLGSTGTTTIKSGAGVLRAILVGTVGAGCTMLCYDNTAASGTVIENLACSASGTFPYNAAFATGLTCVISTAAAGITVTYD